MTINVINMNKTDSLIIEQLAHLGIGRLLVIDSDKLDRTNLNRVVGASAADVGKLKVDVAKDNAERIAGDGIRVEAVPQSVVFLSTAHRLLECDFIFGCTDTHGSR